MQLNDNYPDETTAKNARRHLFAIRPSGTSAMSSCGKCPFSWRNECGLGSFYERGEASAFSPQPLLNV